MKTRIITLLSILCLGLATPAAAQMIKMKGQGICNSRMFKPGTFEARDAITSAKKDALARYAATFAQARYYNYERAREELMARIDEAVTSYTLLDDGKDNYDKAAKRCMITIEAHLSGQFVESVIQKHAAAARTAALPDKAGENFIALVFVARELASMRSYDDKRTSITLVETEKSAQQTVTGNDDTIGVSTQNSVMDKTTTGGSTEVKNVERNYRVSTISEVNVAVNSVLTTAGYEGVNAEDAGLDMEAFKTDFSTGDIAAKTRADAVKSCREQKINYLCTATMDVGLPQRDSATGLVRVHVSVTAQVSNLQSRFPKTVASINGKPYAGLGPDADIARKNALDEAARNSATELVDQLRLKAVP